ncbi:putative MFS transporter superfamily [Helianthus anomalus]
MCVFFPFVRNNTYCLCLYYLQVNISISILPMSKEFNLNSATVGLIQSSFFWGYLLTQVGFAL